MAAFDGQYDCVTTTPMGDQKSVLTIITDGDGFTGTNAGPMATLDVTDGMIEGNRLSWKMKMTAPMPMTMEGEAVIEGDEINGTIKMGAFGSGALRGARRS